MYVCVVRAYEICMPMGSLNFRTGPISESWEFTLAYHLYSNFYKFCMFVVLEFVPSVVQKTSEGLLGGIRGTTWNIVVPYGVFCPSLNNFE